MVFAKMAQNNALRNIMIFIILRITFISAADS